MKEKEKPFIDPNFDIKDIQKPLWDTSNNGDNLEKSNEGFSPELNFDNMNFNEYKIHCLHDFIKQQWNKIYKTHYKNTEEIIKDEIFQKRIKELRDLLNEKKRAHQPIKYKTSTKIFDKIDKRAKEIKLYKWPLTDGPALRIIYTILGEQETIIFSCIYKKSEKNDITNGEEQNIVKEILNYIDDL